MLNQLVIVGRLVDKPKLITNQEGKKMSIITLAVSRSYKNANGEYETDFIDCILWTGVAENTVEYCRKNDILGVKGRIITEVIDGTKVTRVVAEKVSFLSTNKSNSENDS